MRGAPHTGSWSSSENRTDAKPHPSGKQVSTMTVIALPSATRIGTDLEAYNAVTTWSEPRDFATSAAGLVHGATAPLLRALEAAVADAAVEGVNDTGTRKAADALRDARIVLDLAVTAAGRALADREIPVLRAS